MLKNLFTVAFRSLRRRPGYAGLNVAGLAVGLACCLLIALYVRDELSYDRYHEHADRIVRMGVDFVVEGEVRPNVSTQGLLAPAMVADLPEVEHAVRLSGTTQIFQIEGELFQEESLVLADSALFDVFTLPLRYGDPATALREPGSFVPSVPLAERLFGTADAVGRTVETARQTLTVTGVMEAMPEQSHDRFEGAVALAGVPDPGWWYQNWFSVNFLTYALLRDGTDLDAFRAKLPAFLEARAGEEMAAMGQGLVLHAEALPDVYLRSDRGDPAARGSLAALYIFGAVALFVLLIACVNFTNLATARSVERAREVGVRKTLGAPRSALAAQFLAEAVLLSALALGVALVLVQVALPGFNALAGKTLRLTDLGPGLALAAALALGVGLLAGAYPAFVLSGFRPARVLKGRFAGGREGTVLRQGLVVLQFGISVALIAGTAVVFSQLRYMQDRDLGFDPGSEDAGELLMARFGSLDDAGIERLKTRFEAHPAVSGVTSAITAPTAGNPSAGGEIERPEGGMRDFTVDAYLVDPDFVEVYGMEIVAGRAPGAEATSDSLAGYVLNETAVREAGYASPNAVLGREARFWGYEGEVVGVVRDFHTSGLQAPVEPLALVALDAYHSMLTVRVRTEALPQTLAELGDLWAETVPSRPFDYAFVDEAFGAQYEAERRFGRLFGVLAGLAIFIACLGLFGLAAYATAQRKKEIGIRKVLGASVGSVVVLLSKDVVKLVAVAFAVAAPVAYLAMDRWLDTFAYRTGIGPGVFLLAGTLALVIALGTVSTQALRAASVDPVEALRSE
ncbi:MAG: ABC transporter permease [Bacteroidota bacterium]